MLKYNIMQSITLVISHVSSYMFRIIANIMVKPQQILRSSNVTGLRIPLMLVSFILVLTQCNQAQKPAEKRSEQPKLSVDLLKYQRAYFASGCFWCVEAVFESVTGVVEVVSGYSGGTIEDASYDLVSAGLTDHAESVEVYYDSTLVSYNTLLTVFFDSHDPTTKDRQGPDSGRQYRSAIFYQNDMEKKEALAFIEALDKSGIYRNKIITEVSPFLSFHPAEDYHQNYERLNPDNPYVRSVSVPRLKKFQEKHPELLKNKDN